MAKHFISNGVELVPCTPEEDAEIDARIAASEGLLLETQWRSVRSERDALLTASDWVITKALETSTSVPQDWADYRQALRDLPQNTSDPFNVAWPSKPS